jgi:ATP-dependent RNA helicase HelY
MVVATETLALGINMPARTVVLERLVKYNGEAHVDITAGEYTQLTGRAGRRGIDVEGHAVVVWHPDLDPASLAGLASTRTYPLRSSFRPSYTMAVGLVARMGKSRARDLLETSFAQFQADRSVVGLAAAIRKEQATAQGYLSTLSCHLGDFEEYSRLRHELSQREKSINRERGQQHRHDVEQTLRSLQIGDVITVRSGRRPGPAVVVAVDDPAHGSAHPTVVTLDRRMRRISAAEFSDPIVVLDRLKVPRGFSSRSAVDRRNLASSLRELTRSAHHTTSKRGPRAEDEEILRLREAVRRHPCHGCDDREQHARIAEKYWRLQRQIEGMERTIGDRTHTVARQFDHVCDVLTELGYLIGSGDSTRVTAEGSLLAGLYTEKDLLVSESLRRGLWSDLDAVGLAAVVSGMLFESRQSAEAPRLPSGAIRRAVHDTADLWSSLHAMEKTHGLWFLREPDWGLVDVLFRWARGSTLTSVLTDSELSAGDFVRWTKQVIDLLGQIADTADEPMAQRARDAAGLIDRGVIRYSSAP